MTQKVLIYHHYDQDGYLSASIVTKHLGSLSKESNIQYLVGNYKEVVDRGKLEEADIIFLLDYSLPLELMVEFSDKLIWNDHHKIINDPGFEALEIGGHREVGKSGCLLTWEFLYTTELPYVVKLVNDRDVWNWQLGDDTAAFHEATIFFLKDYNKWIELLGSDFLTYREALRGHVILDHARIMVDNYNDNFAWSGTFETYPVIFVNGSSHISGELHKRLREHNPDAEFAFLFTVIKDKVMVGLYRKDGSTVDMSVIAKAYGGGGHAASAGFCAPLYDLSMLLGGGDDLLLHI